MSRFTPAMIAALLLLPSAAHGAGPLQRYALVVGANSGGAGRPQLRYAVSDAERFARVLIEIGGVAPGNEIVLRQPRLGELVAAIDRLTERIASARQAPAAGGRIEVVVYYSGHADSQGLLLGDDRYSYRTLREKLDNIPADVRIAVLDACSSGAFTRIKGGKARPPFLVDESSDMRGHAFLTSSAESEVAQESDRIGALVLHALPGVRLPRSGRSLRRRESHVERGVSVRVQRDTGAHGGYPGRSAASVVRHQPVGHRRRRDDRRPADDRHARARREARRALLHLYGGKAARRRALQAGRPERGACRGAGHV